jgi:hypothetical protein
MIAVDGVDSDGGGAVECRAVAAQLKLVRVSGW